MRNRTSSDPHALRRRAGAILFVLALTPRLQAEPPAPMEPLRVPTAVTGGETARAWDAALPAEDDQLELTLDDAIALALERNLALRIERYQRSQTLLGVMEALGIFDFEIDFSTGLNENSRPTSSRLEDADVVTTQALSADLGLAQLLPSGGRAGLSFNNDRFTSTDRNAQPNPSYSLNLGLTFSQPLLRGFGRTVTRQSVLVARNDSAISREDFQIQVEDVVQRVSNAYWDLVEARNQLRVAEQSLALARELHQMNILREEAGILAPLEVTRSEADVAAREEEIISRQAAVEDRSDQLRGLLDVDRDDLWGLEIDPVTPPEIATVEIDVAAAVEHAHAGRPELRRLRLANENLDLAARAARNQVRPRLDLQASWSLNALEGNVTDFSGDEPVVIEVNDYLDTLDALLRRDFEGWRLALSFSYPLQNRSARARKASAELALEQADLEERELEQQILIEVRSAARAVDTAARQIASARRSSELAAKTLEVEELSYRSGQSSGFEILQSQERLRDARSREASAITSYRRALTAYHRSIGSLLDENRIELADDDS